ncbi:MAG: GIY-YIG nuclease family protein [Bacteroidia bacterium]|nr:GIY-YIG nuclease family protein [Bacteroidia bacterium]
MSKISWDNIQRQSDEILSDGVCKLTTRPYSDYSSVTESTYGNYLISLDKQPYYIGEAKEINKRLRQQFKPATSTFYKGLQKLQPTNRLAIDSFKVQTVLTQIGRKEIEEFGIVNLPTKLNSLQLDKRNRFEIANHKGLWDNVQEYSSDLIKEGEERILNTNFINWFYIQLPSSAGLYLVKDPEDKLIYVGESSDIKERLTTQSTRTYFSALRRHVGTNVLGFNLQERQGKKRYFADNEDEKVTDFLRSCKVTVFPLHFGRYEFEEFLIRKHRPLLNRKENKEH